VTEGGALFLRAVDHKIGLTKRVALSFTDARDRLWPSRLTTLSLVEGALETVSVFNTHRHYTERFVRVLPSMFED
jgi:hypothetical protein